MNLRDPTGELSWETAAGAGIAYLGATVGPALAIPSEVVAVGADSVGVTNGAFSWFGLREYAELYSAEKRMGSSTEAASRLDLLPWAEQAEPGVTCTHVRRGARFSCREGGRL